MAVAVISLKETGRTRLALDTVASTIANCDVQTRKHFVWWTLLARTYRKRPPHWCSFVASASVIWVRDIARGRSYRAFGAQRSARTPFVTSVWRKIVSKLVSSQHSLVSFTLIHGWRWLANIGGHCVRLQSSFSSRIKIDLEVGHALVFL